MSLQHKALGYRPPTGSLASDAQAAASKHPEVNASIVESILRDAALSDAARIETERGNAAPSTRNAVTDINLDRIGLGKRLFVLRSYYLNGAAQLMLGS